MLASFLLALSFMMGSTATAFFESVVFLFVQHPYDVGDSIEVEGIEYKVREMQLLTSVLEQSDGAMVLAPNAQLAQKFIRNHRRSADEKEAIWIDVDFNTPDGSIHKLNQRMSSFLRSHRRDYKDDLSLSILEIWRSSRIKIELTVPFRGNIQDEQRKIERRNRFLLHLKGVLADLNIQYQGDLQRVRLTEESRSSGSQRRWPSQSEGLNQNAGLDSSGSTLR
ncbi:Mechanosensitive ion channel-domain-containing protein [Piptocephalis cylindrospora]|uniref:Mechanosensitive ion channel-domain-containing protein n=1 Tax=Piptocephalis cylindrospora TaxID=1907219 RepID=A0A4P9XYJ8_9FUNG|nr:Mechanosensitive ion channel-domain-containing protein [Piptocephalis cylindrospora]|eukprot:RKP11467.1 Mechanosensitive ion channel-domain-containing protein [Piptocephalis cylindrospora]